MKRILDKTLGRLFAEVPSRIDNMFVGLFQIAMGLWLLIPGDVFAPTLKIGPGAVVFSSLEEWYFSIVMIVLGVLQVYFAKNSNWSAIRKLALPTVIFWVFIVVGYIMVLPNSTSVITFSAFTLLVVYEYLELSYWANARNLPNKRNFGSI